MGTIGRPDGARQPVVSQGRTSDPDKLIRTRSAEPIKASGLHVRPHRKAAHMTASDQCASREKTLARRGHPHTGHWKGDLGVARYRLPLDVEQNGTDNEPGID